MDSAEISPPESLARLALCGDKQALNRLVSALQDEIYGLALRMIANREDAEDATQEILIRLVTHLSQFDFRSKLKTWAYRIAVNYILDVKKSPVERMRLNFDQFAEDLVQGISSDAPLESEQSLLIEEVKIGCTLGMLQCLDREHRMSYVLGEIMELSGPESAEILEISADLFRKRLQIARTAIINFTKSYCGLASDRAPCRCNRQIPSSLRIGRINVQNCNFATAPSSYEQTRALVRQVDEARWAIQVHRSNRPKGASSDFAKRIMRSLDPERGS